MSKGFDYSKWDNIELSDDEDDCHPNIDKDSWFRMKHRSRVEREDNEGKDKAAIQKQMDTANQRIKVLQHDLRKATKAAADDSDDDDDDLDDTEGLKVEIAELEAQVATFQAKLDEYEKNKKWNVDNICTVTEERTVINPGAADVDFTSTGFSKAKETIEPPVKSKQAVADVASKETEKAEAAPATKKAPVVAAAAEKAEQKPAADVSKAGPAKPPASKSTTASAVTVKGPSKEPVEVGAFETYPEFTEKYAETIEVFMQIESIEASKEYLLKYGDILLQENASNYLLLASLEDEMNGHREKMKRTARQSQFITNIAELSKTLNTHPGNVIAPFFKKLETREHLQEFLAGHETFYEKIISRAVVKKAEIDAERAQEAGGQDLSDVPVEQRLGPGGLDPLEVIETLPQEMVTAFESRDVEQLKQVLLSLDPEDAERHMKRCVDSGLWVAQA